MGLYPIHRSGKKITSRLKYDIKYISFQVFKYQVLNPRQRVERATYR